MAQKNHEIQPVIRKFLPKNMANFGFFIYICTVRIKYIQNYE